MPLDFEPYNNAVNRWKDDAVKEMKAVGSSMGIKHRDNSPSKEASLSKVNSRVRYSDGIAIKVSIRFPRQLIYTHKGAGKGRGGTKGSRWIDKMGNTKKTDAQSLGKMGTGGRKEKPFINKTLSSGTSISKLADIAAEHIGGTIVNNLLVK